LAPLRDKDQRSDKVCDAADVQAAPTPPVNEYVSDSKVGSDDEAPATSRRAPSKVAVPRCTQQTAGKISASRPRPRPQGEEEEEEADQVRGVGRHDHN
jgi:hypothetical protein